MSFIPADESRPHIWFFDHYTRWLLKRHFKQVWVQQQYSPGPNDRTIYFLNHNMWWDGLIPLFLNRRFFHQNARAIMEDKQLKQYSFFRKIGAFSINLEDSRSVVTTLRYALRSMERKRASLFIYPEGNITPVSEKRPNFKPGLAWLYQQLDGVDFVPIAIYSQNFRQSKPELYLSIGEILNHDNQLPKSKLTGLLEHDIHSLLDETRKVAGFSDQGFTPQF